MPGHVTEEVLGHTAVHGAAVGLDSLDDLVRLDKSEHLSYICGVVNPDGNQN